MGPRKDTKTALLETALRLIWSHSYETISVDDICKAADAKKGSFYHYFESKAHLAKEALEFMWEKLRPECDHIFSSSVPALDRLRALAEASYRRQAEAQQELGYVIGCPFCSVGSEKCGEAEEGLAEKAWEILSRYRKYFVVAVRDVCDEGGLDVSDHEAVADRLFTFYLGAHLRARLANSLAPLDDVYSSWLELLKGAEQEAKAA